MTGKYLVALVLLLLILGGVLVERLTLPETNNAAAMAAEQFARNSGRGIPPEPFTHDGCTLFPDRLPLHDLTAACLAHDMKYWLGGSAAERKTADIALADAIAHTGPLGPALATFVVYPSVRLFGDSPITLMLDAEWGYGWDE